MDHVNATQFIVRARGLAKRFNGRPVVRGIDFNIPRGRCFGILGPNGAGKTTTLRIILGLTRFDAGTLEVFDLAMPRHGEQVRAGIGVVPQADNLDPDFTVVENLRVYGSYFSIARQTLESRIQRLLDFVELTDRANSKPNDLSGGMRRRLTIARALINDPELIVLDEPTTGLDPQVRHLIWSRLRELLRAGKTLLLTTHYMEEAERLCDGLMIMDEGVVLDEGTPADIVRRHVEPEVIEIRGGDATLVACLRAAGEGRVEAIGDTVYCHTAEARPIIARLQEATTLTYLHRPANLEDVFLKLTGRELRE